MTGLIVAVKFMKTKIPLTNEQAQKRKRNHPLYPPPKRLNAGGTGSDNALVPASKIKLYIIFWFRTGFGDAHNLRVAILAGYQVYVQCRNHQHTSAPEAVNWNQLQELNNQIGIKQVNVDHQHSMVLSTRTILVRFPKGKPII